MSHERINRWVRPEIREIAAYHVPEPGELIKLDAMENPYPWPDEMMDEWVELLKATPVNRYPDPAARKLTAQLREAMAVPEGMSVLLGNGSDEIIQMLAMAVSGPGRVVLAPEPSFVMYRMIATFCGMDYVGVPLKADFSLDCAAVLAAIAEHQPAITFLAYPNNPTGNLFDDGDIETILEASDGLVVVDEAYHAFAQRSWMERLGQYDNLLVMRTVSKLGLAGLRLGLLAGPREWLTQFDKVRLPYNINVLTQASVEFALRHIEVFDRQTAAIREARAGLLASLQELDGVSPYPSDANFILFRVAKGKGGLIFEGLKNRGVLIKSFGSAGGPLADCLRVTVGTPEENAAFLDALRHVLAWSQHDR